MENYLQRGWASQKLWVSISLEFSLHQRVTGQIRSCLSGLRGRSHQLNQAQRFRDVNPQLNSDGSKKQTVLHLKIMAVGLLQVAAAASAPTAPSILVAETKLLFRPGLPKERGTRTLRRLPPIVSRWAWLELRPNHIDTLLNLLHTAKVFVLNHLQYQATESAAHSLATPPIFDQHN